MKALKKVMKSAVLAILALVLGAATAWSTAAQDSASRSTSDTAASPDRSAETGGAETVYCALDAAPPVPCKMTIAVDADMVYSLRFTFGSTVVRFEGRSQTGWWSGRLNGQPAMGYELNRGHTVYSTTDLGTRFEWWYEKMEHGEY